MDEVPEMVDFFWEPPPPNQQNGIITEYNIVCTPIGSGQPVNFVVNDESMSGILNATVGMFIPATQYFCSITASTSAGPGPVETRNVITRKETVLTYRRSGNFPYIIYQLYIYVYRAISNSLSSTKFCQAKLMGFAFALNFFCTLHLVEVNMPVHLNEGDHVRSTRQHSKFHYRCRYQCLLSF